MDDGDTERVVELSKISRKPKKPIRTSIKRKADSEPIKKPNVHKKKSSKKVADGKGDVNEHTAQKADKPNRNQKWQNRSKGPKKPKENKKDYRKQLYERRKENGIWLLSKKEEDKIYRVKKAMRNKGASPDEIKAEVRKMRRQMELQQKKTEKHCFKCRKRGHMVADCPEPDPTGSKKGSRGKNDLVFGMDQAKICYKCGSTEHSLYQCTVEGEDLPFASCYICGEKGHLSRHCPKNDHGIYPKGGSCKKCGSVNHLIKDCPDLEPEEAEEPVVTVKPMGRFTQPEIEEYDLPEDKATKKAKVVKF